MSNYYALIVFFTVTTMMACIIQLIENQTLSRRTKNKLILIAVLIILGVLCEFASISLNGSLKSSRYTHGFFKAIEFIVSPIIPICYVKIVDKQNLGKKINFSIAIMLIINTICELVSIFIPFIFRINENNIYECGNYYFIYKSVILIGIIIFIITLLNFTQSYQSRNLASVLSIVIFFFSGVSIQFIDSSMYFNWLIIAITLQMFIMYYSDVSLKVDALTNLFNRKSYENQIKKIDYPTVVILFDANDFKLVNDTYGHQYGDTILKVISKTLLEAYKKFGYCYRLGGDEFCVILKPRVMKKFLNYNSKNCVSEKIDELNVIFDELLKNQCDEYPVLKSGVSKGYSIYTGMNDVYSFNDAVKMADNKMYLNKKQYKEKRR